MCQPDLEPTAFIMLELHYLSRTLECDAFLSALSQKPFLPDTATIHNVECICHNTTCELHVGLSYEGRYRRNGRKSM